MQLINAIKTELASSRSKEDRNCTHIVTIPIPLSFPVYLCLTLYTFYRVIFVNNMSTLDSFVQCLLENFCSHICMYVCVYVYMYVCVCVCVCVYIYMHTVDLNVPGRTGLED